MDTQTVSPENTDERIVWYAISGTYIFYLFGALYVVAPVIGWILMARLALRWWQQDENTPDAERIRIPMALKVWVIGMLVMLIALVIAHVERGMGTGQLIKSSIGWAKGWALLAVFPLVSCLPIRPQIIYRAACRVCRHTILLLPVFVGAWAVGLPTTLYVSPLQAVGGPGPEFFSLNLYEIDPGSGTPRWRLFTPWAPALGFIANVYFLFALRESHRGWRRWGMAGSILMILMTQSRLALVSLVLVWGLTWALSRLHRPALLFAGAGATTIAGMLGIWILDFIDRFWQAFRAARAGSTRVRETLGRIAVERWRTEAPWFGHGTVERGPHLVEYMPIGSHHSWYGLLFVKGAVGLLALAIPMLWSFFDVLIKAQHSERARVGLSMVLLLFLYTFGENLEILAYLFWPALIILGIAHHEPLRNPHRPRNDRSLQETFA